MVMAGGDGEGIVREFGSFYLFIYLWVFMIAQLVRNPSAMQETPVRFLGQEDPLEKG